LGEVSEWEGASPMGWGDGHGDEAAGEACRDARFVLVPDEGGSAACGAYPYAGEPGSAEDLWEGLPSADDRRADEPGTAVGDATADAAAAE
jgi:hypothetical protein